MAAGETRIEGRGRLPDGGTTRFAASLQPRGLADNFPPSRPGTGLASRIPKPRSSCGIPPKRSSPATSLLSNRACMWTTVGGVRIEHNYLITATGYERLSNHVISLS